MRSTCSSAARSSRAARRSMLIKLLGLLLICSAPLRVAGCASSVACDIQARDGYAGCAVLADLARRALDGQARQPSAEHVFQPTCMEDVTCGALTCRRLHGPTACPCSDRAACDPAGVVAKAGNGATAKTACMCICMVMEEEKTKHQKEHGVRCDAARACACHHAPSHRRLWV